MLEAAEAGRCIPKDEYEAQLPQLRLDLVQAQFAMRRHPRPVLLLLAGNDRPGANATINRLSQWLDPRFLLNRTFRRLGRLERRFPAFRPYWNALPPAGRIALFLGGWARRTLELRIGGGLSDDEFARRLAWIRSFESTLVAEGAILLKFWLHLPQRELRRRRAETRAGDPDGALYRRRDVRRHERYAEHGPLVERVLAETSLTAAPWRIVESADPRFRDVTVARSLLAALLAAVETDQADPAPPATAAAPPQAATPAPAQIEALEPLAREDYQRRLEAAQLTIRRRTDKLAHRRRPGPVLVFEGWDAAGKGGAVRRLVAAIDAANYRIHPIAAPDESERRFHYLWRFWTRLQPRGMVTIFDRSWYGRLLVERVEAYATPAQWGRAYAEINDFEEQLAAFGHPLLKFWLHVSPAEQLRRFRDRENAPHKRYKITADDWRNRDKRPAYESAVCDMLARTSTPQAPWHAIDADDKRAARVAILETVAQAL